MRLIIKVSSISIGSSISFRNDSGSVFEKRYTNTNTDNTFIEKIFMIEYEKKEDKFMQNTIIASNSPRGGGA